MITFEAIHGCYILTSTNLTYTGDKKLWPIHTSINKLLGKLGEFQLLQTLNNKSIRYLVNLWNSKGYKIAFSNKPTKIFSGVKSSGIYWPLRAWIGSLKQRVPITKLKFKGETQHYVIKLPKSTGARH